jgi:hypothetical protein
MNDFLSVRTQQEWGLRGPPDAVPLLRSALHTSLQVDWTGCPPCSRHRSDGLRPLARRIAGRAAAGGGRPGKSRPGREGRCGSASLRHPLHIAAAEPLQLVACCLRPKQGAEPRCMPADPGERNGDEAASARLRSRQAAIWAVTKIHSW